MRSYLSLAALLVLVQIGLASYVSGASDDTPYFPSGLDAPEDAENFDDAIDKRYNRYTNFRRPTKTAHKYGYRYFIRKYKCKSYDNTCDAGDEPRLWMRCCPGLACSCNIFGVNCRCASGKKGK